MIFRQTLIFILLITQFTQLSALGLNSNARTMALSGSNVAMNTTYNSNDNIASLVNSQFNGFSVSHQINYFVKELSVSTIQFSHSIKDNSRIEGSFDYSGDKIFSELNFQIGFGKKLGDKINGGIKLNYNQLQYADQLYSKLPSVTATICLFAKATNKIHFGCMIFNPTRTKITREQNLPAIVIGGLSYLPSDKVKVGLIAIQESGIPMNYCIGIEYLLLKEIEMRFSYKNNENVLAGGLSLIMKKYRLEFGFRSQSPVGNSSAMTLLIPVR
ncbi:MAG: hypothetical protein ACO1G9_14830 [Bacteroidota bacterium]